MKKDRYSSYAELGLQAAKRTGAILPRERAAILRKCSAILSQKESDFSAAISNVQGKPLSEANEEVRLAAEAFAFFSGEAERASGAIIADVVRDTASRLIYQSAGLCAALTASHHPLLVPAEQIAAAFSAGSALLLSPDPETISPAQMLLGVLTDAGFPDDAVQILPDRACAAALASDRAVRYIYCEADEATAKAVAAGRVQCMGRAAYRCGDCTPMVVCEDADPILAAQTAAESAFANGGQNPWAVKRAYIARSLYEPFKAELVKITKELSSVRLRQSIAENLHRALENAADQGAVLCAGGPDADFFHPAVLEGGDGSVLCKEHIPGPYVCISPVDSIEEAAEKANASRYGMCAVLFTNDLMISHRLCTVLDVGSIAVNQPMPRLVSVADYPRKESGSGASLGADGMRAYMLPKHIRMRYLGKG